MRRDPYYQALARELRTNMTRPEQLLWQQLRANRLDGHKFRRQHAVGSYIVDFVCLKARLIIEIDGDTHEDAGRPRLDEQRTAYLQKLGFRVLRFWNHQIIEELEIVIETITDEVRGARVPR
jgi:very-short-patch-repair endonuclease